MDHLRCREYPIITQFCNVGNSQTHVFPTTLQTSGCKKEGFLEQKIAFQKCSNNRLRQPVAAPSRGYSGVVSWRGIISGGSMRRCQTNGNGAREVMSMLFTIFGMFIAVLFFFKATTAFASGRIDVGWAFEPIVAHRSKEPFLFWFMLAGSILMGVVGSVMAICTIIFPTT